MTKDVALVPTRQLLDLPEELLLHVLHFLDIPELLYTSRVGCFIYDVTAGSR